MGRVWIGGRVNAGEHLEAQRAATKELRVSRHRLTAYLVVAGLCVGLIAWRFKVDNDRLAEQVRVNRAQTEQIQRQADQDKDLLVRLEAEAAARDRVVCHALRESRESDRALWAGVFRSIQLQREEAGLAPSQGIADLAAYVEANYPPISCAGVG